MGSQDTVVEERDTGFHFHAVGKLHEDYFQP